ncbi:ADP-ribosylglycohydrolase family protein [Streptomyces sp. BI20]|uniref:ADP-ribosylglycohydrolase family protein n=1 Tax=Streptomyces sp. BI20 TaxID=3403460 RepID=UPI003C78E364
MNATGAAPTTATADTAPGTTPDPVPAPTGTPDTVPTGARDTVPTDTPNGDAPAASTGTPPTAARHWDRATQQDYRARVRGTLLGAALGDALGAPVAGLSLAGIRAAHGPAGLTEPSPAFGRRGAVTATTQLAVFTTDGLIRAHVRRDGGSWHPPTDLHRAYLRWADGQHDANPDQRRPGTGRLAREDWLHARRGPDRACLTGFGDPVPGTPDTPKNPTARDAAAAARSAPFGLLVDWEPRLVLQLTVECAAQSHGHPTATLAAGALATTVHGLTRGRPLTTALADTLDLLAEHPGHDPVTAALHRALDAAEDTAPAPHPAVVESLCAGRDADDALAVAAYCALVAVDVRHGLRLAVNHGGDSTVTGALTGALLGARDGETALPALWLAELEGRATLLELADDFALEMTQGHTLHGPTVAGTAWANRYPAI